MRPQLAIAISVISIMGLSVNATAAAADQPLELPGITQQGTGADSYAFTIGDVRVTALSDGSVPQNLHKLLHGITKEKIDERLAHAYQNSPAEASITGFLLEVGDRIVLVDTGAGEQFGPGIGGNLLDSLDAVGFSPDDVTDVLITHAHSDHVGGLVQNGQIVFSNATVHIGKPDIDFFLDSKNAERFDYNPRFFEQAILIMTPYADAEKIDVFDETTEILPGLTASLRPGHTPGSAFYTLESQGQTLTFIGDIIHAGAVQFPDPSVTIVYDLDEEMARKVRSKAFSAFANDSNLVASPHLSFPGVGHIRKAQEGYDWVPISYGNREIKKDK